MIIRINGKVTDFESPSWESPAYYGDLDKDMSWLIESGLTPQELDTLGGKMHRASLKTTRRSGCPGMENAITKELRSISDLIIEIEYYINSPYAGT